VKPYPSYKPSGVAWLGDVPSHWQVEKIKHLVERLIGGATPSTSDESSWDNKNGIPWISIGDMSSSDLVTTTNRKISDKGFREKRMQILPKGTVIYSMYASVGFASITKIEAVTNQAIVGLVGIERLDSTFLMSYLNSIRASVLQEATSNTQDNINAEKVRNIPVICPPLDEQEKIAHYLDTETARIDTLIQEKEELIGLLQESKASEISSLLLNGVSGEHSKPSGIKWLGDVPSSWTICRIKHTLTRLEQGWSPECENRLCEVDEWGVLKAGACNHGFFSELEHKALPKTLDPIPTYEIMAGDVLMSRASGSADLVGSVAYVEKVRPQLMLSDKMFRLVPEQHVDGCYLASLLNTNVHRRQILASVRGSEGLARNITTTDIKQVWVALPKLEEQKILADKARQLSTKYSNLIAHTQEEITLLKKLRAATIADAVLGRVDVRTAAKP
jgi:type I restriction enzyme, S subunit